MIDFFQNFGSWVWVGVLVVCIGIEAGTLGFTTIWAAIAAVPMIFIAKTGLAAQWQALIFIALTVLLIVFTRPFALKKMKMGRSKTNVNTMVGEEVLITKTVTKFQKGEAKAKNGVVWTTRSDSEEDIPEGTVCKIVSVEGNTISVVKS